MVNADEEIGRAAREYADNRRRLAAIKACMGRKAELLEQLGGRCRNMPSTVHIEDDHFRIPQHAVPFDTLDELRENIAEYREAVAVKERLEICLENAGLKDLISPENA